jgi:hypothetical protein
MAFNLKYSASALTIPASLAGFALLTLFGLRPADAQRSSPMPSAEQCFANHPDNSVFINTCPKGSRMCPNHLDFGAPLCLPQTAAEKAEAEREAAMADARESARRIIEQERQRQIDQEVARLGAHRRAEAIRNIEMRRKAEEARGKAEDAEALAKRLAAMTPDQRAAYERCRELARTGHATCQ